MAKGLALITGASSGIGFELAKCCVEDGYDAVICANEPEIAAAAARLRQIGPSVDAVEADLATTGGIDRLWEAIGSRQVDLLLANVGRGLGGAFLDQPIDELRNIVHVNIVGQLDLVQRVARTMRDRGRGRILFTGSIAGHTPGSFHAVYTGTKAFIDNFSYALRNELKDTGVTVTCLMPGATDTEFFERNDLLDTPIGRADYKADPAKVARDGYCATQDGEAGVVNGFMNKILMLFADILPDTLIAEMHRKLAEPDRK